MALTMRWVGETDLDRIAETRWKCYAHANNELARYKENIRNDPWGRPGDYLLAEQNGDALGTATSLPLVMWTRGAPIPCQGVAYVGTVKSARRRGKSEPGIASAVMNETLRLAREQNYVVSALMPFRVSFYEHFGYGLVERRSEWTLPLSVLPTGDCSGWRFLRPEDRAAQAAQWQAAVESGNCDVERSPKRWTHRLVNEEDGMVFIDRPDDKGPARASAFMTQETVGEQSVLKIQEWSADSIESFVRFLRFLGTLRDQYSSATITVPFDLQINRLLREPQVPHRQVDHPHPKVRTYTRMQLRILDHRRFLESQKLPALKKGKAQIAVRECEGEVSRFAIDCDTQIGFQKSTGSADFECSDHHWAAIVSGDLRATEAVRLHLATENRSGTADLLDAFATGTLPFCREYF